MITEKAFWAFTSYCGNISFSWKLLKRKKASMFSLPNVLQANQIVDTWKLSAGEF